MTHEAMATNHAQIVKLLKMTHDRFDTHAEATRNKLEEHQQKLGERIEGTAERINSRPTEAAAAALELPPPAGRDEFLDLKGEIERLSAQMAEMKSSMTSYFMPPPAPVEPPPPIAILRTPQVIENKP